jgi:hypothetical protein
MGTSTNRPKPKSGQSAARNGNGKPSANQEKTGAAEPNTTAATDASDSSAKAASSGALSSTAKTTSGALSSTARTPANKPATRPTTTKTGNKTAPAPVRTPVPPRVQTTKRDQKREELSRKIEERRVQREREQRNKRVRRGLLWGVPSAVVLIGVGVLLYNLFFGPQVAPYLRGATIDGISCDALEQTQTHYHAHLQIYVNGTAVPIPGDVGRQSVTQCYYWLHVHSDTGDEGVIHIESPNNNTYNLKQFFDIWGQQLSATNLMGYKVDASHKLTVYVYNDPTQPTDSSQPWTVTPPSDLTPYTGDPTKITLKPHELIVLEYGTPVVPPQPWTFLASE